MNVYLVIIGIAMDHILGPVFNAQSLSFPAFRSQ